MELHESSLQDCASSCHPIDAHDALAFAPAPAVVAGVTEAMARLQRGHVLLDRTLIRQLRQARMMSQQDLANDCWRRNIPLSLTTIKRAELGRPVRFRIAREFARCFEVPVMQMLRTEDAVVVPFGRDPRSDTGTAPGAHPEGLTGANAAAQALAAGAIRQRSATGLS